MIRTELPIRSCKRYFLGTHRACAPEETWERIQPVFERVGITRVADVTGLDRLGIPVYQAIRPASRNLCVSQGKGLTRAAARTGAAMESIEGWHAERLDGVPQTTATLQEMAYANPIANDDLRWARDTRVLARMPLRWLQARSLATDGVAWLPRDMLELDFTAPRVMRPDMFIRNSNGLASGNERDEALLHGLCEVIERHAWRRAQLDPQHRVPVDLDSVDSEPLRGGIERVRAAGFKLALYDITWEIGIPAALAQIVAPDLPVAWHGAGCHVAREVAVSRALTEAAQSRLTQIAGARDDLVGLARGGSDHRVWDAFVEPEPRRSFHELPDLASDRIDEDLRQVVARLAALGHEPYWIDLTRPEIGIPVVSTYAAGLKLHD